MIRKILEENADALKWAQAYLLNEESLCHAFKSTETGDLDPDAYQGLVLVCMKRLLDETQAKGPDHEPK